MKRIKRFFGIFGFLLVLIFAFWLFSDSFVIKASADIEPTSVELSIQQTLALFGTEFYGSGYTSSNGVSRVTFKYLCMSSELRNLDHLQFWNYYESGGSIAATDAIVTAYNSQDFLVYACDASLVNNDSSHLFTVYTPFSIDLQNIQFYRERFWFSSQADNSRAIYSSTLDTHKSTIQLTSSNSAIAYSQLTEVFGSLREPNNSTTLSGFPLMWTNLKKSGAPYMLGQPLDLYYHPTGENGAAINFDVNGIDIYMKNVKRYTTPSSIADWFGVEYEGTNPVANALFNKDVFFLYIAPPIISDGFVLPDNSGSGSGSSPDYSEQIDNINTNTSQMSANLAAILAKLDLIYRDMYRENNVSLTPPQTIGFDSQTKSEIIGGLSSGASVLDSQSIPEAAQQAAGGVWAASDRILGSAPGLAAIYLFIFVSGLVSWVIFGKRGG